MRIGEWRDLTEEGWFNGGSDGANYSSNYTPFGKGIGRLFNNVYHVYITIMKTKLILSRYAQGSKHGKHIFIKFLHNPYLFG